MHSSKGEENAKRIQVLNMLSALRYTSVGIVAEGMVDENTQKERQKSRDLKNVNLWASLCKKSKFRKTRSVENLGSAIVFIE